jgi:hypothetical protein
MPCVSIHVVVPILSFLSVLPFCPLARRARLYQCKEWTESKEKATLLSIFVSLGQHSFGCEDDVDRAPLEKIGVFPNRKYNRGVVTNFTASCAKTPPP